jgi:hypothetical protein
MCRFVDVAGTQSKILHINKRLSARDLLVDFKIFVTIRQKLKQLHETLHAFSRPADISNGRLNTGEIFYFQNLLPAILLQF